MTKKEKAKICTKIKNVIKEAIQKIDGILIQNDLYYDFCNDSYDYNYADLNEDKKMHRKYDASYIIADYCEWSEDKNYNMIEQLGTSKEYEEFRKNNITCNEYSKGK